MSDDLSLTLPSDPPWTARAWGDGRGFTLQIHAKYLNYDVADELKPVLHDAVRRELEGGVTQVVIDVAKVSIVDSCGVGLLIGLHHQVQEAGGTLWLAGVNHFLQKILRMMHLDPYFKVVANEQEAQRQLATPVA